MRPTLLLGLSLFFVTHTINAQVADFSADVTAGCFPLTVKFTDLSTGSPTQWSWDFGNGNSSPLQNPSAVYSEPGVYTVSLKATKNGISDTKTKTAFINVFAAPDVNFSFDVASGCAPLSVNFHDESSASSGTLTNWFWVFGDGGTSQSANPTWIFDQPGQRTISLKVRNAHGCEQTKVLDAAIDVKGPAVAFTPSSTAICTLPALFTFSNNTTGTGTLINQWNFGDGTSSTDSSPSHNYTVEGNYEVSLTVTDGTGCTVKATDDIFAGSDTGVDFTTTAGTACLGGDVTFTATSTDPIAFYEWTLGNGLTSTDISPVTSYDLPGVYTVTLEAILLNHNCPSIITKQIQIKPAPVPQFEKDIDCHLNLLLYSTSTNASRLEWYINDVLVSTAVRFVSPIHLPGEQNVRLVVYNEAGCDYPVEDVITLVSTPIAHFKPTDLYTCKPDKPELAGCAPFTIAFENTSTADTTTTWIWDFGDGSGSTSKNPTHVFTALGTHEVKLTAFNNIGCSTFAKTSVRVSNEAPIADIIVDKTQACPGEAITFTALTQNAEWWCWNFGDGWISDGMVTAHSYSRPGIYTVTLTAKNGCNKVVTKTNLIAIKNPDITFGFSKSCTDPFNVDLVNMSSNFDELHWDFGDGQTSTQYDVGSHRYAAEGEYMLQLIGKSNSTGCEATAFVPLTIQQVSANFTVNAAKQCAGLPLIFTNQSHAAVKWNWTLGPYSSTKSEFDATLFTPGDYIATLEVKDSDSCVARKEVPIQVINMKGEFSFSASSTCDEFAVQFKDNSTGTPAPTSWLWEFGDGATSTEQDPVHHYTSPGSYDIVLHVSNVEASCAFTKEDAVDFRIPLPDFATAKPKFCLNEVVTFANTSTNSSQFQWFFGDGRTSPVQSPQVAFALPGSYTITLIAKDDFGCEQRIIKPDFVEIVQPIASFSVDNAIGSCPPFTATFHDHSESEIVGWQWSFGDDKTSTVQNPVNIYDKAGLFNVALMVTDANGCTDQKVVPQFVTVGGPSGSFTTAGWGGCDNQSVSFSATTLNTAKMTWDFGDGVVIDETQMVFNHKYNSTGTFTPSLLLTDGNGCKVLADGSMEISIRKFPVINTEVTPTCVSAGDFVGLHGTTDDDHELFWTWTMDGGVVATGQEAVFNVSESGSHIITGHATNEMGCTTSIPAELHVQGEITTIPNVITPDGDKNEYFTFEGLQQSQWELGIIDRWGKSVYEEKEYVGTWDGGDLPAGVYYYVLKNELCKGLDYKGVISVVR